MSLLVLFTFARYTAFPACPESPFIVSVFIEESISMLGFEASNVAVFDFVAVVVPDEDCELLLDELELEPPPPLLLASQAARIAAKDKTKKTFRADVNDGNLMNT